jgi:hypothetical protein
VSAKPPPPPQAGQSKPAAAVKSSGFGGCARRLWDVVTLVGASIVAALWYYYSGLAETKPDLKSALAIVLLPLFFIVFRRFIDRLLIPLQPLRNQIPRLVRLGIGLAVPFLVANYLYSTGSSQFEYMFRTVVVSTLISYIILRNPTTDKAGKFLGALRQ